MAKKHGKLAAFCKQKYFIIKRDHSSLPRFFCRGVNATLGLIRPCQLSISVLINSFLQKIKDFWVLGYDFF
jgi:hypothetical protein